MDLETPLGSAFGAVTIATVLLAGVIIRSLLFSGPKKFDYPIYGAENEKPSSLMQKFQHQADILLVDAYKKVFRLVDTMLTESIRNRNQS